MMMFQRNDQLDIVVCLRLQIMFCKQLGFALPGTSTALHIFTICTMHIATERSDWSASLILLSDWLSQSRDQAQECAEQKLRLMTEWSKTSQPTSTDLFQIHSNEQFVNQTVLCSFTILQYASLCDKIFLNIIVSPSGPFLLLVFVTFLCWRLARYLATPGLSSV